MSQSRLAASGIVNVADMFKVRRNQGVASPRDNLSGN